MRCPNSSMTVKKDQYFKRMAGNDKADDSEEDIDIPTTSRSRSSRIRNRRKQQNEEPTPSTNSKGRKRRRSEDFLDPDPPSKRRKMNAAADVDSETRSALCEWTGELRDLSGHTRKCPFALILCEHCKVYVLQRNMPQHLDECSSFPMQCEKCSKLDIPRWLMPTHLQRDCQMADVECCHCSATMLRLLQQDHLDSVCPQMAISCALGCGQSVKRVEMDEHINSNASGHLKIMLNAVNELKDSNQNLQVKLDQNREEQRKCTNFYHEKLLEDSRVKGKLDSIDRAISSMKATTNKLRSENATLHQKVAVSVRANQAQGQLIRRLQNTVTGLLRDRDELDSEKHELEQRVDELEEVNRNVVRRQNQLEFNVATLLQQGQCHNFTAQYRSGGSGPNRGHPRRRGFRPRGRGMGRGW